MVLKVGMAALDVIPSNFQFASWANLYVIELRNGSRLDPDCDSASCTSLLRIVSNWGRTRLRRPEIGLGEQTREQPRLNLPACDHETTWGNRWLRRQFHNLTPARFYAAVASASPLSQSLSRPPSRRKARCSGDDLVLLDKGTDGRHRMLRAAYVDRPDHCLQSYRRRQFACSEA